MFDTPSDGVVVTLQRDDSRPSTPPEAPQDPVSDSSARFIFEVQEQFRGLVTFQCQLDSATPVPCTSPYVIPGPIADGQHTFIVYVDESAPNSHNWTIGMFMREVPV